MKYTFIIYLFADKSIDIIWYILVKPKKSRYVIYIKHIVYTYLFFYLLNRQ